MRSSAFFLSENTPAWTLQISLLDDSRLGSTILGVEGWNGDSGVVGLVGGSILRLSLMFGSGVPVAVLFIGGLVVSVIDISGFTFVAVEDSACFGSFVCEFVCDLVIAGPTMKYPTEKNTAIPAISSAVFNNFPDFPCSLSENIGFTVIDFYTAPRSPRMRFRSSSL